ncbi:hypothetical protein MKY92_21480 [Paenibacillus sp. FSL R5-0623]|uniref:hypothetical protein n=1 Tax=Paenibacillus sp. FSL R5-0623 TaxID=2921651 RepID=UPI0030DCB9B9
MKGGMTMEKLKDIKCIVWDLDHTIWDGVLLESSDVQLKPGLKEVIEKLDQRGILHPVASKNDAALPVSSSNLQIRKEECCSIMICSRL